MEKYATKTIKGQVQNYFPQYFRGFNCDRNIIFKVKHYKEKHVSSKNKLFKPQDSLQSRLDFDVDKDKDGLVTLDEFRLHLLEEGKGMPEDELKDLFEKADKNKDGKIDVTEFKEEFIRGKANEIEINPGLAKVFKQLDVFGFTSCVITIEEEGKGMPEDELKDLFEKADKNKDGKIDVTHLV